MDFMDGLELQMRNEDDLIEEIWIEYLHKVHNRVENLANFKFRSQYFLKIKNFTLFEISWHTKVKTCAFYYRL